MKKMLLIPKNRRPTHPGSILLEEFLKPMNLTITSFALHVGMTRVAISEIIHEKRGITPLTAMRFAKAFGTTEEFWINLQLMLDLYDAHHAAVAQSIAKIKPLACERAA